MELGDLRVVLGLSSYKSDSRWNWMENFESVQGMELFYNIWKEDDFCIFNPYLGTFEWILKTTDAGEVRFDVYNVNSLSRNLVRVVQFKIHSCFRTGARQRNPHSPIPKLALVDTV